MGIVGKDSLEFRKFLKSQLVAEFNDGIITDADVFGKSSDREKRDLVIIFHHISRHQALGRGEAFLFLADTVEQVLQRDHS